MGNIGAIILAAGGSSRFGRPKQLLQFRGRSLVHRITESAYGASCSPVVVVVGSDARPEASSKGTGLVEAIRRELRGTGATIVENENWQRGIGTSIRAGVKRAMKEAPDVEAITLLVCDQPFVDSQVIQALFALRKKANKAITASRYADTLGVPAVFDRVCFQELLALGDGNGAKPVILRTPERVAEFPFAEGEIDIDKVEDYEAITDRPTRPG